MDTKYKKTIDAARWGLAGSSLLTLMASLVITIIAGIVHNQL